MQTEPDKQCEKSLCLPSKPSALTDLEVEVGFLDNNLQEIGKRVQAVMEHLGISRPISVATKDTISNESRIGQIRERVLSSKLLGNEILSLISDISDNVSKE